METIDVNIDHKKYGHKIILEDVRLSYPTGQIHAIMGANGSGKTTLFKCMMGHCDFAGKRVFDDTSLVGYLPADLYMYPYITGEEFIRFYIKAKGLPYDEVEKESYNQQFDLPLNEYAVNYSTGMLKKLYLMALLLQHNRVLILDEPFNGLDYESVRFVTSILCSLREKGNTVFVASHLVEHLLSFSDTVAVIEKGFVTLSSDFDL